MPVFTCKSKCAALIVNLGSFSRGRKQTAESAFSQHLEYDYSQPSKGSLVKSLAQRHLFRACEASEINQQELEFLHDRGWSVIRNRSGDIMIGSRTNFVGESMKRLAGSTLVGEAHNALPLTYMIVVIVYGKTLPIGQQGNREDFPTVSLATSLTRAGSDRIRVCMFHLNNVIAAGRVALAHEALGTMFADCLHYQVDLLGGDANMALYRATGRKQESVDSRGGMYQSLLDYFLEAWAKAPQSPYLCFPRVQHVSANSLCLLKQYEDLLGGQPYKDILIGAHSLVWIHGWPQFSNGAIASTIPSVTQEFKVTVSEWLLNSTSAAYLLNDRDYDSHTPLLIGVHANQFSGSRMRAMNRNPETVKEAADRRKARQKANKARGSADPQAASMDPSSPPGEASSGAAASSSGSRRPPEPPQPPSGHAKGKGIRQGHVERQVQSQRQGEELTRF